MPFFFFLDALPILCFTLSYFDALLFLSDLSHDTYFLPFGRFGFLSMVSRLACAFSAYSCFGCNGFNIFDDSARFSPHGALEQRGVLRDDR